MILLDAELSNRIFGLDFQTVFDAVVLMLAVGFLFFFLSYVLWNPARKMLEKRKEKIANELKTAEDKMNKADALKEEYEAKLTNADKDVEEILSEGRKKALARENQIVAEANEEAKRIRERAEREIELEKSKAKDDLKQEIISVANVMAGKFVKNSLNDAEQSRLIDEALNEMGDDTWQN